MAAAWGREAESYLDFADAIAKQGKDRIEEKYGNLLEMRADPRPRMPTAGRCGSTPRSTTRWVASG